MDEIREKLKPLVGKRIKIRGCLSAFKDWMQNHRDVGRACIAQPEMDGEVIAHHVWVMGVQHWLPFKTQIGKQVEFNAVVKQYADRLGTNYHLINPDDLQLLHGPPALTIPNPPEDEVIPPPEPDYDKSANDKSANDKPAGDPLETLRQVKQFIKAIGGQEQAEKVAKALEAVTVPVPQLIQWIRVLGE